VRCPWPEMEPKGQVITTLSAAPFSAEYGRNSTLAAAAAGLLRASFALIP